MENIDTTTLANNLTTNPVIIDVREEDEFAAAHIPGAQNIPLSQMVARHQEIPDGAYVICRSGARSASAQEYLAQQGKRVINVTGGMLAWPGATEAE